MSERINVWEHPLSIWKTKSQYFVWLRGNLRRIWSDNPLRKEWKKDKLRPITTEEKLSKKFHTSTKNLGQCYQCKEWMAGSKLECDHIEPSEGCYDFETAEKFLWHCAANNPDNWALVCKPCHKIISYCDSHNLSFEEGRATKLAIEKEKEKTEAVKSFLKMNGLEFAKDSKGRRKQLIEVFMREEYYL